MYNVQAKLYLTVTSIPKRVSGLSSIIDIRSGKGLETAIRNVWNDIISALPTAFPHFVRRRIYPNHRYWKVQLPSSA